MKKLLITCCLIFLGMLVFAQGESLRIAVNIKGGRFTINKAVVTDGWNRAAVTTELGAGDRKRPGFNTTHTYDDLGIVLFEKNDDSQVPSGVLSEIQLYTAVPDTNSVSPKRGLFIGKMQIEGLKISNKLSWPQVKAALKDYKQTDSYLEHSYRLSYKGLYIYFQFDAEETTLRKLSIGKDMKGE